MTRATTEEIMRQILRRPISKARAVLLWAVLLFAAGQIALGLFVHRGHPELCDPAFTVRLHHLRDRLAEGSGRPLVVVLGSSRPALAFCPSLVRGAESTDEPQPILFNFAYVGSGPVREWMVLRRLLAEGVRPDWVLLEVWWPFLAQIGAFNEEQAVFRADWDWVDVPLLAGCYHQSWGAASRVMERHLTPAVHYRLGLLNRYASFLLSAESIRDLGISRLEWCTLDKWGGQTACAGPVPPEQQRRSLMASQAILDPVLRDFHISELSDRALHALLDECRSRGIKVALFVMPEHSSLRGCYTPRVKSVFYPYLARLRDDYQLPVIDARTWCRDEDFGDQFHLFTAGANAFSTRFGRDAYQPLLEGRPLPSEVLFREDAPLTSAMPPRADKR
jgi:hypothetical protein